MSMITHQAASVELTDFPIAPEQIIAGDVDEVLRRLQAFIEETGPFGTLILMSYDWDDKQSWLHSLDLFANELMPALNRLMGAQLEGAR